MTSIKEKTCKSCRRIKPVSDFYENKYSPDGRYAFCRVCFDRFAKKLKEKETASASAPAMRTCVKCGKARPIDAFKDHPDAPDHKTGWCLKCRWQAHADVKKQKPAKATIPGLKTSKDRITAQGDIRKTMPSRRTENPPADRPSREKSRAPATPLEIAPVPRPAPVLEPTEEFDYIDYLLDEATLKIKAALEKQSIPKQINKITPRKRICNGCGKTEEIDKVEKNTVIPVHAWFCNFCQQKEVVRLVRKGMLGCDYWGREFKIKKIISQNLVMGVLKNKNNAWDKKLVKIYGNWRIA